ncbi:putative methyltransferase-domain-containing protein [Chytriomyces sp. MP71]|nr:putative methyltransferase-domain-containing protein [Chytriomyces sp. MP71]
MSTSAYEYELNDRVGTVTIGQDSSGLLGLTVWDSALVAAKYLERRLSALVETGFDGRGTFPSASSSPPDAPAAASAQSAAPTPPTPDSQPQLQNSQTQVRIVELGSGTGLLGIVAARVLPTANVTLTDTERVIPLTLQNVRINKSTATVAQLDWTLPETHSLHRHPNLILVSDCVYDPITFDPLINTLNSLCHDNTLILIAYERRVFDTEVIFFKKLGQHFRFRHVQPEEMDPRFRAPDEIYLFLCTRRISESDF